jgi:hypothetical protein
VKRWVSTRYLPLVISWKGRALHPSHFIDADRPGEAEVEAAARELHAWGQLHHWWTEGISSYDAMDPIGKDEFDAIVENILMSAAAVRRGVPPNAA